PPPPPPPSPTLFRSGRLERRQQRGEIPALGGAARRVVLRVEVQHQPLATVVGQGDGIAAGQGQRENGGDVVTGVEHFQTPQNFIGSRIASRFRWSQNSRKSSRRAAICMLAGTPMVICAENMSAPVCIAR